MPGRMFRPKVIAANCITQAVPLAPSPPDDTAALRCEIARLRAEIALHQRSIAFWREIAESEHGQIAARLVHAEHRCSMLRFLLFSAWVKLGEKARQ